MSGQKVVLVTGAARGLGLAHAERFVAGGYRAVITDLNEKEINTAVAKVGPAAVGWRMDVRDEASVKESFARVKSELGRLDVLVNNAGISKPSALTEVPDDEWTAMMDVHLSGSFRCAKFAYPLLAKSKGAVVNTSSGAGVLAFGNRASYSTAKAGILGFTRDVAVEWAKAGVRVNAVIPGVFATEMLQRNIDSKDLDVDRMTRAIPMGRFGEMRELSDAVFFMGDAATYMTGQSITIDGGLMVRGGF